MARRRSIYRLPKFKLKQKTITAVGTLVAFSLSVLSIVALFTHSQVLMFWRDFLNDYLGVMKITAPIFFLLSGLVLTKAKWAMAQTNVLLGFILLVLSSISFVAAMKFEKAGLIGQTLWTQLSSFVTPLGAVTLLILVFLVGLVVFFNTSLERIFAIFVSLFNILQRPFKAILNRKRTFEAKHIPIKVFGVDERPAPKSKTIQQKETVISDVLVQNVAGQSKIWKYPPLSLLSDKVGSAAERGDVKKNADIIEKTLDSFGVQAKVAEVNGGPAITQYALRISAGTKISKIANLQHDIALSLATPTGTVRIEAPIPGKSLVGIEVPNHSLEIVGLKQILASKEMQKHKSRLSVVLGRDTSSKPMIVDIDKMPHVLIAGTTGSGKSVLINAFITSLLFRNSPDTLKMILIDPKRVELTNYNGVPHLLTQVITESEKILSSLKWAMAEMDRRFKLFQSVGVRNITGYNEMSGFQALPYIVIIIDELADLMMFAPVEIEDAITRIAQLARATGIHLVIATQRPSVDVITGLIKANIPCRIAFNVSSMIDSRVILDGPGAEKLLGRGDMLFLPPDVSKPVRIQGVFVQDNEIKNLIKHLKNTGIAPEYTVEVTEMPIGRWGGKGGNGGEKDKLFDEAVRTICQYDRASASLLQRRLRVGYARAARIIDELEEAGIIGPGEGSKPRDVLVRNADEYFAAQNKTSVGS
ncbi:DNA translocase FtsK [Patescibacteria group bacterium]|nr:DNA translocase FtsK [Patescibacteria group bacterium]